MSNKKTYNPFDFNLDVFFDYLKSQDEIPHVYFKIISYENLLRTNHYFTQEKDPAHYNTNYFLYDDLENLLELAEIDKETLKKNYRIYEYDKSLLNILSLNPENHSQDLKLKEMSSELKKIVTQYRNSKLDHERQKLSSYVFDLVEKYNQKEYSLSDYKKTIRKILNKKEKINKHLIFTLMYLLKKRVLILNCIVIFLKRISLN